MAKKYFTIESEDRKNLVGAFRDKEFDEKLRIVYAGEGQNGVQYHLFRLYPEGAKIGEDGTLRGKVVELEVSKKRNDCWGKENASLYAKNEETLCASWLQLKTILDKNGKKN